MLDLGQRTGTRSAVAPWAWRPQKSAWFVQLRDLIRSWDASAGLTRSAGVVREALTEAAEGESDWLVHPFLSAVTISSRHNRAQRNLRLASLVASHRHDLRSRVITDEPFWLWSADGGVTVQPGVHEMEELGLLQVAAAAPTPVALDVWADSISSPPSDSWANRAVLEEGDEKRLQQEIVGFLRAIELLRRFLPDCLDWMLAATRVVVPLQGAEQGVVHSGSRPDIPGTITSDLHPPAFLLLETLVHETAHRHLFFLEARSPLVEPGHNDLYKSPLRSDPRPLRGIFLAYHALAFIGAFYRDALSLPISDHDPLLQELNSSLEKAEEARTVLESATKHLTALGLESLKLTDRVAQHASRRP